MTEMPDVLKLHADGSPDKHAVIVDASHGARPSVTTFAELNELVNDHSLPDMLRKHAADVLADLQSRARA